jgi:AraC family transcriptional regulator, regulatory protein of adaptative response / methylated-DNA-[protein]-cysteine methyltransferase
MGRRIQYSICQSTLGYILIATGNSGICAIFLGDDPAGLVTDLQTRFPEDALMRGGTALQELESQVRAAVELPGSDLSLALDCAGTAFQQRVWGALREIRAGSTATYADIAGRIGAPKAVRAVARACGANPVAVAIPCHRIVRQNGDLAGYRWGLDRKRELLRRESLA